MSNLWPDAREGDKHALDELLEAQREWMLLVAKGRMSNIPWVEPEGVVNSALVSARTNFGSMKPDATEAGFQSWLSTILINLIRDEIKRSKRYADLLKKYFSAHEAGASEDPARAACVNESWELLSECTAKLDRESQEIIRQFLDGVSFVRIAERWGRSPDGVERQFKDAAQSLGKCMGRRSALSF